MPTPHYYLKAVRSGRNRPEAKPRNILIALAVVVTCVILANLWPAFDSVFGRAWFVLMVCSWVILAPAFAFRKKGLAEQEPEVTAGDWVKAVLCDLWTLLCIWFIYAGVPSGDFLMPTRNEART